MDAYLGNVQRIAVFRALGLGDMICATPALRALRQRFPQAEITLISQPWAENLASRLDSVDDFIAFPGHPDLPESAAGWGAWSDFIEEVQSRHFDLLIQLHGNGSVTNGLVTQFGARHVSAFHEPHRLPPDPVLGSAWPISGSEPARLLSLIEVLSSQVHGERLKLEFPLRQSDVSAARALLRLRSKGHCSEQPYVVIHPGAKLASRRWPSSRFMQVAIDLRARGYTIVLTGTHAESELGQQIERALPDRCVNLVGLTSLWSMGALIQQAALLVCNDTGVSHVAAAVGTRSVVISCGSEVERWAPMNHGLHRVLWSAQPCRPCTHAICPHQHECATAISSADVIEATQELLTKAA